MKWSEAAEQGISRVPFFVRKRVRKRVEEEAVRRGDRMVDVEHVEACRQRMMQPTEGEIQGYRVETCFGFNGCSNLAFADPNLLAGVERQLTAQDLVGFLKSSIRGPLKWHHEFRVSISACPNACSQPQIADFGMIGARLPRVGTAPCNSCGACVAICREGAISLADEPGLPPLIDCQRCLACGQCLDVCPTGVLEEAGKGFRVLLGGKLGRHPQLGKELPGTFAPPEILLILGESLDLYFKHSTNGERFGAVLQRIGTDVLTGFCKQLQRSSGLI